jgi:hypothetical protein
VVIFAGLLASYTFQVLAIGTALYIAHIPFAWRTWRRRMAEDEANGQSPMPDNGQANKPDTGEETGG